MLRFVVSTSKKISERKLKANLGYTSEDGSSMARLNLQSTDLVIPVIGPTGAGKSSLINAIVGKDVVEVGHFLKSCTKYPQPVVLSGTSPRVILLDTPGFDDSYINDVEILRRIAIWLSLSYHKEMKLAGLIYLHDISQDRISGSIQKNMELFRVICGEDALRRVIIISSKWDRVGQEEGLRREAQLRTDFWSGMVTLGARTLRFLGDRKSARYIIDTIIDTSKSFDHVEIQNEFVQLGKILPETEAGNALVNALKETAARQKALDERMKQWVTDDADPMLRQEYQSNHERLQATLKQIQDLKIPLSRRLQTIFGLH